MVTLVPRISLAIDWISRRFAVFRWMSLTESRTRIARMIPPARTMAALIIDEFQKNPDAPVSPISPALYFHTLIFAATQPRAMVGYGSLPQEKNLPPLR